MPVVLRIGRWLRIGKEVPSRTVEDEIAIAMVGLFGVDRVEKDILLDVIQALVPAAEGVGILLIVHPRRSGARISRGFALLDCQSRKQSGIPVIEIGGVGWRFFVAASA